MTDTKSIKVKIRKLRKELSKLEEKLEKHPKHKHAFYFDDEGYLCCEDCSYRYYSDR